MAVDPKKKDFAQSGTESFNIGEVDDKDKIVLNIEQDKPDSGVLIEEALGRRDMGTGNFFLDAFQGINQYFIKHSKVKIQPKATFYHLLAVMVNSGIPMVKALRSLVQQTEKSPRLKQIIEELADYIEGGASLSDALSNYPDVFNEQEVGMVQSGEASGQLSQVLDSLAEDTEKAYNIRMKVKSAMTYPVVIFVLLIGVISVMMIYVIPQLTELFEGSDQELPLITKIVVGLSDFMVNQKLMLVLGVIVIIGGLYLFKRTPIGAYFFDKFKISIPIFGKLFKMSYLARFARTLSNLLQSRISIVKAMEINANSIGNEVYRKRLLLSTEDIKQGIPIAESITESDLFPPMMVSMLETGEKTAQLDTIAAKVAEFYENEVDTAVEGISKIIEPVILIVIGLTVGGVVAAIMLPIMQLTNLSGGL